MSGPATRRLLASALFGAILPLAFVGGIALQSESPALHADRAAFHILLPALLFGMMAFAIWILTRQQPARPLGSAPISSMRR
ncbi:hypothetical protein FNB15_04255 [Ferrovibrio terrae]|uniref:Uncharacterized protein n=1 Tax=Ferrovibrio terrae TaxID=2594003 RepID=A0A516GYC4_9PROT|nr:hypothetical protein [Ferrovibrio terrae]QDO96534.1 hypothetical protein FNB15_04255 [Ferrovibrio terrae]